MAPGEEGARDGDTTADLPSPDPDAAPVDPHTVDAFDTSKLHRVDITVAEEYLIQLDAAPEAVGVQRVPCTIVFDGAVLPRSGIRKKGGRGSGRPLSMKAAFSIKFNEFVKGQKLGKLSKLLLNNAVQDPSLLNEHLANEIARRAGMAAPLTAHAAVTFNGQPYGYFIVREAINDDFLRRNFGKENEDGNLYEGGRSSDFLRKPDYQELKDEIEEMRSRDDIRQVASLATSTPDAQWIAVMSAKLDLPSFITGYALEMLFDHWDGYFFLPHNYYVYDHPGTGRFLLILAGMDSVFFNSTLRQVYDPPPRVLLGQKFLQFPQTRSQLENRVTDIVRDLDVESLHARIDQVERILVGHGSTEPRFRKELKDALTGFRGIPSKRARIDAIKAWRPIAPPPPDAQSDTKG
jgi:hypothetical protein